MPGWEDFGTIRWGSPRATVGWVMLSPAEFEALAHTAINKQLNAEQSRCVAAGIDRPLLIIAGPGSGKTTVMVLRALRHVLVDGMEPESIAITTFTRKAAQEVRTRWLDWGLPLIEAARSHPSMQNPVEQAWLGKIDLNRCTTGTLDSICETLLGDFRPAGTIAPVLIDGYPANQRLLKAGVADAWRNHQGPLEDYLSRYNFDGDPPRTQGDVIKLVRVLVDRFVHDRVDLAAFRTNGPHLLAKQLLADAFDRYCQDLGAVSQMDFALLEKAFLERLESDGLQEAIGNWRALLVDEYQDTNPLQEAIYFKLVEKTGATLSVVGDDDQSLYRFRGATVELFTQFVPRLKQALGLSAHSEALFKNYRSTPEITRFVNSFAEGDPGFSPARIQPPKPRIKAARPSVGLPIMGLFRPKPEDLARDLSDVLDQVFRKSGFTISLPGGGSTTLARDRHGGDFGDAVVLAHSTAELKRPFGSQPVEDKFPALLRRELAKKGVGVFNPRGQALADQLAVKQLLGLMLECIDRSSAAQPDGTLTPAVMGLTNAARGRLLDWRACANAFIATDPAPGGLRAFVDAWAGRQSPAGDWPDEWPVLELAFKLIAWMPGFQHDPEWQVWLEAITRGIAQSRLFSPYRGQILNTAPHDTRSRDAVIRDILRPIAEGLIDIDEEILPSVPRDRVSFMTIHQSKGLEFPLVIVDISSGYKVNHPKNAQMRFPKDASTVTCLEDDLAPFTQVGQARLARSGLDRSFDDLMRLYYVAYSRAQTALLVIGSEKTIVTGSTVKTVASGWRRDGTWTWHQAVKPQPTFANNIPMVLL